MLKVDSAECVNMQLSAGGFNQLRRQEKEHRMPADQQSMVSYGPVPYIIHPFNTATDLTI